MASKFGLRDKVVVKGGIPQYFGPVARLHRVRTIAVIYYNKRQQHNMYYLGTNKRGVEFDYYGFRASELAFAPAYGVGRPRTKRRYQASSGTLPLGEPCEPLEINPVVPQGFMSLIGVR